jgi:hypothetical protein
VTNSDEDFLGDIGKMPYHIIDKAEFSGNKVLITFKSGSQLEAIAPNETQYKILMDEFVENLGKDKIFVT